ncbi:hypothetical protein C8T65DRAFT_662900, partial [Cerioporus squamosus]
MQRRQQQMHRRHTSPGHGIAAKSTQKRVPLAEPTKGRAQRPARRARHASASAARLPVRAIPTSPRRTHDARRPAAPRQPPYASPSSDILDASRRTAHARERGTSADCGTSHDKRAFPRRYRERISVAPSRGSRNSAGREDESDAAVQVICDAVARGENGERAVSGRWVNRAGFAVPAHDEVLMLADRGRAAGRLTDAHVARVFAVIP